MLPLDRAAWQWKDATLGIDAHKRSHTVVTVDEHGTKIAEHTVGPTAADHLRLLAWAESIDSARLRALPRREIVRMRLALHANLAQTSGC